MEDISFFSCMKYTFRFSQKKIYIYILIRFSWGVLETWENVVWIKKLNMYLILSL